MTGRGRNDVLTLPLFAFTLFLSAALMFAIQPMMGKMLLPLVGGTPAGWIVAMAFFQVMLLAGYFYAHALSRLPPRVHGAFYVAALAIGLAFLPAHITTETSATMGALDVFLMLSTTVAIPFIALSATSSTIQRLFTATPHKAAADPYFLYAASNLGSFTGLFLYPLAFEQLWGLHDQARYWTFGYGALIAFALACLGRASHKVKEKAPKPDRSASRYQRLEWLLLAFFPSALLLAVTTHISTDIFSAPMLWVLPLALYLLTFVVAFSPRLPFSLQKVAALQPVAVALALGFLMMFNTFVRMSWHGMMVHLVAFTIVALMCHMRLAAARPVQEGRRLTEFYLMLAVGGALGGILNAFVAPAILNRLLEYPVLLILSCVMNPAFRKPIPLPFKMAFWFAMFTAFMYALLVTGALGNILSLQAGGMTLQMIFADAILFFILLMLGLNTRTVFMGGLIMLLLSEFVIPKDVVAVHRNFYGVIKVIDYPIEINGAMYKGRYMYHGTTTHGLQIKDPKYETVMTTYFSRRGPAGDLFTLYDPKKVAILGLGAGTLNCFSTPRSEFTFFEIDPAVRDIAADPKIFTFLSACKGKRAPDIQIGDGRLLLAGSREKFDLIVLDAFSSDTIPAHLLTTDAIQVYLDHLSDKGFLLFNLSNRYFNLASAVSRNAEELNLKYAMKLDWDIPDDFPYASSSLWLAMGRPQSSFTPLQQMGWVTLPPPPELRPWTDDYTNLLSVFEVFRRPQKNKD